MKNIYQFSKTVMVILILLSSYANILNSKPPEKDAGKTAEDITIEKTQEIIKSALKEQGVKRLKELIKLSKQNAQKELSVQFAEYNYVKNPNDAEDKSNYAKALEPDTDPELSAERVKFFKDIVKNCKKMKKILIYDMSSEDEPIGHAFGMTIPAVKWKGDFSCDHYSISFRYDLNGKLLVTEWYSMPGNHNCQ